MASDVAERGVRRSLRPGVVAIVVWNWWRLRTTGAPPTRGKRVRGMGGRLAIVAVVVGLGWKVTACTIGVDVSNEKQHTQQAEAVTSATSFVVFGRSNGGLDGLVMLVPKPLDTKPGVAPTSSVITLAGVCTDATSQNTHVRIIVHVGP